MRLTAILIALLLPLALRADEAERISIPDATTAPAAAVLGAAAFDDADTALPAPPEQRLRSRILRRALGYRAIAPAAAGADLLIDARILTAEPSGNWTDAPRRYTLVPDTAALPPPHS